MKNLERKLEPKFGEQEKPKEPKEGIANTEKKAKEDLKSLGFINGEAIKDLEKYPIGKVKKRIGQLRAGELKFRNPVGAIEKFPPLINFDIGDIRKRINFLKTIGLNSLMGIYETKFCEEFPQIFDRDIHTITFSFQILKELVERREMIKLPFEEKISFSRELLSQNPYLTFSFLKGKKPINFEGVKEVLVSLGDVKEEERERIIKGVKENLPETLEGLKESKDPYKNKFLLKLANQLEFLEENKKLNKSQ
ncbi:hypothetical protein KKH59_05920 [Patescibacteria group bacterium]|nr:hypothetical protein [Patescibacteria group bacterium]